MLVLFHTVTIGKEFLGNLSKKLKEKALKSILIIFGIVSENTIW